MAKSILKQLEDLVKEGKAKEFKLDEQALGYIVENEENSLFGVWIKRTRDKGAKKIKAFGRNINNGFNYGSDSYKGEEDSKFKNQADKILKIEEERDDIFNIPAYASPEIRAQKFNNIISMYDEGKLKESELKKHKIDIEKLRSDFLGMKRSKGEEITENKPMEGEMEEKEEIVEEQTETTGEILDEEVLNAANNAKQQLEKGFVASETEITIPRDVEETLTDETIEDDLEETEEIAFNRDKVLENFVRIELPPVKGSKDKRDAYLVVSEHPTKPADVSLFVLENVIENADHQLTTRDGNVLDLTSSQVIFDNNGVAVNNIKIDKNNVMRIKYYKDKDKVALTRMKATDVENKVRDFVSKNYPNEGKVKEVTPTFKVRKVVRIVATSVLAGAAALTVLHFAVSTPVRNAREAGIAATEAEQARKEAAENSVKDESSAARLYGAQQAQEVIGGKGLFNYVNGNVAIRAIDEAVKNKVEIYSQKELSSYEDKNGNIIYIPGKDYTNATLEGYWAFVGRCAADDLEENGITLASVELEGAEATINYIYPVSPLSSLSNVSNQEEFKANLLNNGYSSAQTEVVVKAYENAYKEEVKLLSAQNPGIIINTTPGKAEYSSAEVLGAVTEKLGEDFIVSYINDDAVFAVSGDGNSLAKITINPELTQSSTDGKQVVTTEALIKAINEGSVETAVKATEVLKSIPGIEKLSAYEYKGSDVFVSEYGITTNGDKVYSMNPTLWIVDGSGVKVKEGSVTVSSRDKNCNQMEMLAAAVFENYWTENYTVERKEGTTTSYKDNKIGVDAAKFDVSKAETKSSSTDGKDLGL